MPSAKLTREFIIRNLEDAQARRDAALREYEAAKAELAWWLDGLRLTDPVTASQIEATDDPTATSEELFPDPVVFHSGGQPTLRQAIAYVMHEQPRTAGWKVRDLIMALAAHGWHPQRADSQKRVSDMASIMERAGELIRIDRGLYTLAPHVAAQLDRRFPQTDYGHAAELGMPAPESS